MSRGLGRTYWVMWAAASASFVGEGIQFGALPLLAASRRAGSGAGRGQPSVARAGRGCAVLWRHKLLRALASLLLVVNLVGTGVVAILVLYVLQVLELPEAGFGWLVATYAVGGVLGALAAPRLSRRLATFVSLTIASTLMGVGIAAMGLWTAVAPVFVTVVLIGFGGAWWNVVTISLRQRLVPRELLGRVTAVYRMVAFAAAPLGALLAGWLAHRTDLRTPYVALGVLQLLATIAFLPVIRRQLAGLHPAPVS